VRHVRPEGADAVCALKARIQKRERQLCNVRAETANFKEDKSKNEEQQGRPQRIDRPDGRFFVS
jgi:hypothetical protein